jgi:hypothetical protein
VRRLFAATGAATLIVASAVVAFGATAPQLAATPKPSTTPSESPSPSPSPSPTQPILLGVPSLSADQIMINAEKATRLHAKPNFITYQMHEVFVHHGSRQEFDYRIWYRYDGAGLMQLTSKDRYGRAETHFGYPFPSSPDNDILLYATPDPALTPPPTLPPTPLVSGATMPPVINREPVVGDRYYSVKLAGVEIYNAKPVYHLTMHALRDERAHPWKDLWIDMTTFDVWKAHANASGSQGPAQGNLDATVEFAPVGQYWLVQTAVGDGALHLGPFGDSGHYEYEFYDFGFPASIPDWYFDPKQFKKHT